MPQDLEYQQLLEKYKKKIKEELGQQVTFAPQLVSVEYQQFKQEIYPTTYSLYEKACNFSEKLLKLKVDEKKAAQLQKNIDLCHLQITPSGVISFSILAPIALILLGSLLFFGIFRMFFFVIFFLFAGLLLIPALQKLPEFMGNSWRMKASNQMVQCIFYLVTYMKHTSNLERAIEFASDHLTPPLSLDLKKVLWDVETQKYPSIKESFEAYLQQWSDWAREFVEAAHLVESSLYESSEERRLSLLDKSLDVILTGTYENMLHYAHNLKSPMTMLHMLGVILPILGLVILPLVVSFMAGEDTSPLTMIIYIAMLYNVTLPIVVYYLGKIILSKRPTGYGDTDISEQNPELKKYKNVLLPLGKNLQLKLNPLFFSLVVFAVFSIIGFSPLFLHALDPSFDFSFDEEGNFKMLGYLCPPANPNCDLIEKVGPYGLGASLLSLFPIAGLGLSLGLYYRLRSKNVYKIREQTKKLEDEFASALFQLGNRLGDGLPAEIAFAKVAQNMENTTSGNFFNLIERNITKLGMGIKEAIFDPKNGALIYFPSKVIESSMKVLLESIKKGPKIAAQALLSMSRYIKEIHRVDERLKDLMADTISSMKSQIKFLTPAISGIVIGITSMITAILTRLAAQLTAFAAQGKEAGGWADMLDIFGLGVPTFYFQLTVGLYIIQIGYILTILSNGIENGADKLGERFSLGKNLVNSTLLYCFLAGVIMLLFNFFAQTVMKGTLGG